MQSKALTSIMASSMLALSSMAEDSYYFSYNYDGYATYLTDSYTVTTPGRYDANTGTYWNPTTNYSWNYNKFVEVHSQYTLPGDSV